MTAKRIDLLKSVSGIRIDRVRNGIVRNLCGGEKRLDERIEERGLGGLFMLLEWMR